jgi:predicted enzyme related to lactoylglutathione lyase
MECFCCGEDRDPSMITSLMCHDDIKVCRMCVGWLNARAGGIEVTPTLPVADMTAAVRFYEAAGFDVERYDDGFSFVHHHEQSVCNLDLTDGLDPATNHAGCYIITADVDAWHARFAAAGLTVTPVEDMPWGMHEFTLTDPSGNHLRIGRNLSSDDDS